MINISEKTTVIGYDGKIGTLQQALCDKNLHHAPHYSYFGPRVCRGEIDVFLGGEWRAVRFDTLNSWARKLEVL